MRLRNRRCGWNGRSLSPSSARRRFAASGLPWRTANTPAFSRGCSKTEATSPAAKTPGCEVDCSVASTAMKPVPSTASPDAAGQRGGRGGGGPDDFVHLERPAGGGFQPAGVDPGDARSQMDLHAARGEHVREALLRAPVVRRQHGRRRAEQMELGNLEAAGVGLRPGGERVLHRQRQLHAGGARAYNPHPQPARTLAHPLRQALPARDQPADRLYRHGVLDCPLYVEPRRDAGIDRQHVVGHRRPLAAQHRAPVQVEPHRLAVGTAAPRRSARAARGRCVRRRTRTVRRSSRAASLSRAHGDRAR